MIARFENLTPTKVKKRNESLQETTKVLIHGTKSPLRVFESQDPNNWQHEKAGKSRKSEQVNVNARLFGEESFDERTNILLYLRGWSARQQKI